MSSQLCSKKYFMLLLIYFTSGRYWFTESVNKRSKSIHYENSIHHTFGILADNTNQHNQCTYPGTE